MTVVNPNDVLFGRGSGPNDHEGNITFRDLVAERKAEYMATNNRQTKAKIAKAIVDVVFSKKGRFLKKLELNECQDLGFDEGQDVYVVVDDNTIMEKAKQALRQNRDKSASTNSDASEQNDGMAAMSQILSSNNNDNNTMLPPRAPTMQHQQNNQGFPDPIPVRNIYSFEQQPLYMDNEGYATYTATLGDPEDEKLFIDAPNGDRQGSLGYAPGFGGSRRGSLLGGRKDGGRRESLQLGEAFRRDSLMGMRGESMQMSELMESFKGMSTTGDLNSSSDTIGTIDNMYPGNHMSGTSNMSGISMSSTTSLFKSASTENVSTRSSESPHARERVNSSDMMGEDPWVATAPNTLQNEMHPPLAVQSSISGSEVWNSHQINNLLSAPIDSSSNIGFDVSGSVSRSGTVGSPEHMSSSSMSIGGLYQDSISSSSNSNPQSIFDINKSSGRILPS